MLTSKPTSAVVLNRRILEHGERQHGLLGSLLDDHERRRGDQKADEAGHHEGALPTERSAFDDRSSQAAEHHDGGHLAREIDLAVRGFGCLLGVAPCQPKSDQADRDIDQENAAPTRDGDEAAAHERTCGQGEACARRPDGDRATAFLLARIGVVEQGQRVGNQDGCAEALEGSGGDQERKCRCEGAGQRSQREDREAGHENPLGADAIADAPAVRIKAAKAIV